MNRRILDHVQQLFRSYAVLVSVSLALVFLFLHLFWRTRFGIDSTSVALLALILAVPYLHLIRRLRFGELEAEIEPEEVAAIQKEARKAQSGRQATDRPQKMLMAYSEIRDLLENDLVLGLAGLRVRLESALRRLAELYEVPYAKKASATRIARALADLGVIDSDTLSALGGVLRVTNRAVHGAEISAEDASRVVESGLLLLENIDSLALVNPEHVEQMEPGEDGVWRNAMFEMTTIVPILPKPERKVYHVTQSQLDRFLDGYNEYAEYLIGLKPIEGEADSPTATSR